MSRYRPPKLLGGCCISGSDLGDRPVHLRDRLLDDEVEQLLLAREMVVEAALQDTDLVGDVANGGGMVAFGPKYLGGRRNDVIKRDHSSLVSRSAGAGLALPRWPTFGANASAGAEDGPSENRGGHSHQNILGW